MVENRSTRDSSDPSAAARLEIRKTEDPRAVVAASERITVALVPKVGNDLRALVDRTGLSKTDIVNRAISLYEFIDAQLKAGSDLIITDPETGRQSLVRLL